MSGCYPVNEDTSPFVNHIQQLEKRIKTLEENCSTIMKAMLVNEKALEIYQCAHCKGKVTLSFS